MSKARFKYEFKCGTEVIAETKAQAKELRPNAEGDPKKVGEVDPKTSALIGGTKATKGLFH